MLYELHFMPAVKDDIDGLKQYIVEQCSAPLTALRQFEDLERHWDWLEQYAELPAVDTELSIKYGAIIRTIRFGKKMAIVYSVENGKVYVQRIIPQSMIIY